MTKVIAVLICIWLVLCFGVVLALQAVGYRDSITFLRGNQICVAERDVWGHHVREVCS